MSKQTAVEWFYDKIKSHFEHDGDLLETLTFTMAIAKKMEREQRIDFAKKCLDKSLDLDIRTVHSKVEEYYNKTYGGQDE